jgi:hypothetical protein
MRLSDPASKIEKSANSRRRGVQILTIVARSGPSMAAMTETNVELARRGFEAALSGDLDGLREFLDPDVKWHGDPSEAGACQNRGQALEFMRCAESSALARADRPS